jgi:tryptophanase
LPYYKFPGQVLGIDLYTGTDIRACDIRSYMLGNDPDKKKQLHADSEFTSLAIPRRVYTQAHIDIMADTLIAIRKST